MSHSVDFAKLVFNLVQIVIPDSLILVYHACQDSISFKIIVIVYALQKHMQILDIAYHVHLVVINVLQHLQHVLPAILGHTCLVYHAYLIAQQLPHISMNMSHNVYLVKVHVKHA
jgi:hypothetical protein